MISSLVATGSEQGGSVLPWLLVVALAVAGLATLYLWPYARCRWCDGGKVFSPLGDGHWHTCTSCSGSGRRLRTGRQVIGLFSKADRERGRK